MPIKNLIHMKIAAGWLIERAGWKGFKDKNVGVYKNQALVLVNHGNASSKILLIYPKKFKNLFSKNFKLKFYLK